MAFFSPPNYTQTPNSFFDEWVPKLKEGELRVMLVIMRQTFGWQKTWDYISLSQLEKKTGMYRQGVIQALRSLIKKGLVAKRKEGLVGKEKCWYSLVTDPVEEDPIMPDDESDISEDSNNLYQCDKHTPPSVINTPPPSVISTPTKETLTKENVCVNTRTRAREEEKLEFGKVRLSQQERLKLIEDFGLDKTCHMIERLCEYAEIKPKKFKEYGSHAMVIRKWIRLESENKEQQPWKKKNEYQTTSTNYNPNSSERVSRELASTTPEQRKKILSGLVTG